MAPKFSEQELEMLTDEEREGLLDEDIVDEGLEGEGEGDGDAEGGDGDGDSGGQEDADEGGAGDAGADAGDGAAEAGDVAGEGTEGADAAAEAAAVAADAGAGDADDADAAGEDDAEQERPAAWILPADVDDKITALDEQRDKLAEQFDDGEITAQEMRAKLKPIEKELDDLKQKRITANTLRDIAVDKWVNTTVPGFLKEHPQYKPGSLIHKMLDDEVRRLQQGSRNPVSKTLLRKAHETISEQLRAALGDTDGKKDPPPKAQDKKQSSKREVPPTLANVPAADITESEDGGEFAYLDRLSTKDVQAYERELAKLPDHKRDQYLAQ